MPKKLLGKTTPRLFTPPLRPLNRRTSKGYEVDDFARLVLGEPLLPWERWAAIHMLEINPDESFRYRTIVVLVARQNGKSHLARVISLWRMFMYPGTQVLGIAQELSLAKRQWELARDQVRDCPDLYAEWGGDCNTNGQESFTTANGSTYRIKASNRRAGRGLSCDLVIIDELREQYNSEAWSAVSYTTMARPNAQILAMSNAGDDRSTVLNNLRERALAGRDPSIGLFEWSAPDGCDMDDRQAWAQANPALGHTISENAIRGFLAIDPPGVFRTEVLCQKVDHLDTAIDLPAWRDCSDPAGEMPSDLRKRLAACVDVAMDSAHVTLALAAKLPDGRVRVEIAGAWNGTDEARAELPGLLDHYKPVATGWFPSGPAAALAPLLRARPASRELKGGDVTEACQGLADLIGDRLILHSDNPLLNAHVGDVQKRASGDGWRFERRNGDHADAAYAAAGAIHIALTIPEPQRARIRVLA